MASYRKAKLNDNSAFLQFNWKADVVESWIGMWKLLLLVLVESISIVVVFFFLSSKLNMLGYFTASQLLLFNGCSRSRKIAQ